jgi:hypothetical protein
MMTTTLHGRQQRIRDFIDIVFEAHLDPASARPTLGELADCLTDEETAGLLRDEAMSVEPGLCRPHPSGNLHRGPGADVWAHLPNTGCYLHIPGEFAVNYKFEMCDFHAALALQAVPLSRGLGLSENYAEFPISRLIIDPTQVMILVADHKKHRDIEITIL